MFGVPLDGDQLRSYLVVLSQTGASDDRLAAGVRAACATCKWMPKPADIIEHMPQYQAPRLTTVDDDEIPEDEQRFNMVAFPLFGKLLRKEIGRDEFLGRMRLEARKAGVEGKIRWEDFGEDLPWDPRPVPAFNAGVGS